MQRRNAEKPGTSSGSEEREKLSRRGFLQGLSGATAAAATASALSLPALLSTPSAEAREDDHPGSSGEARANRAFHIRMEAAQAERKVHIPDHRTNGDESRYDTKIGNYSKGLPHNSLGVVDPAAYRSLLHAVHTGEAEDFERIIMGGDVGLVNPQAGLAFDLEGTDSHQLAMGPPPSVASAEKAGEAVECYWMAVLRDVPFTQYRTNAMAQRAAAELSRLTDFRGPKQGGQVTAQMLFRGFTAGDVIGPYVSQFLLKTFDFGAITVEQKINTYLPLSAGGTDYMTEVASWLAVQNGTGPFGANRVDPTPRHIRSGRDLSAYVHIDVLYEAYLNACIWLLDQGAPLNPGNPYGSGFLVTRSRTQVGFGTFGGPHVKSLLAEVATRALKAVWYQKWFVHRHLRPEEFGGRVHFTKTGAASYPLHSDVLNSRAVQEVFARNGTYFLPHAFPEGCPQHPSYGQGHATVAGACSTIVKAWFDENFVIPNPVVASDDGLSLVPYNGADAGQITLGGEMNKVAANIGIGRNHAAVHWRSDYADSLPLGEAIAISVLRDQRATYNEDFPGFTFTRFDGSRITV